MVIHVPGKNNMMSDSNNSTPVSEAPSAVSAVPGAAPQKGFQKKKINKPLIIIIIIVAAVLLVCSILILLYALLRPEPIPDEGKDGRPTVGSSDNSEDVQQPLSEPVRDAYYITSMTVDWYFDNGQAVSTNSYVENAKGNTRTVYFDVMLEDGEIIYTSPYLSVGERIEQITLNRNLDSGDYPAVCTYYLVDDDHKVITNVSVGITIHVLN